MLFILIEVGFCFLRMEESVLDSEVDFGLCKEDWFLKVGNKWWFYVVRWVFIGWLFVREVGFSSNIDIVFIYLKRLVELLRIFLVNIYFILKRKFIKLKFNLEWILEFL